MLFDGIIALVNLFLYFETKRLLNESKELGLDSGFDHTFLKVCHYGCFLAVPVGAALVGYDFTQHAWLFTAK